jgi:uncharacterized caspase-like protein
MRDYFEPQLHRKLVDCTSAGNCAATLKPRPRRAFVLTIGVNDYDDDDLDLSFAETDARLMDELLATLPGFEVRRASLTTTGPDQRRRPVTAEHIQLALSLLGELTQEGVDARKTLRQAGHDVSALDTASPDDVVIISFSGHGFADKIGRFALLPSNTLWPDKKGAPDPDTTVTADDLTGWLRYVNAGEMNFIIDACHAGASVSTPDFNPGPTGDAGLGQLAYDKSMRILAATQADDVALEAGKVSRGLLTHVLATPAARLARTQEPSLFDFDPQPSAVIVKARP